MVDRISNYFAWAVFYDLETVRVIRIGDCDRFRLQVVEEFLLGLKIVFHRSVIIQMVMRQVCKYRCIKIDRIDTSLFNSDGGSFQCTCLDAGIHHIMENTMQVINIRGCQKRRKFYASVFDRNRSDISRGDEMIQHITDHTGNRALAVGAGYTEHLQAVARISVKGIGYPVIDLIHIFYLDIGDIRIDVRKRLRMNDHLGTVLDCLRHKTMSVIHHSLFTEKNRIRPFFTAVRHQAFDFNITDSVKQFTQFQNRSPSLPRYRHGIR